MANIKDILIGKPFPTSMDIQERLDNVRALAVFASDPISSNAYATEAMMSVLIVLGSQSLGITWPLGLAVSGLVLLVIFSYIQTILHYPDGGGAYTVAKDNLGEFPSLLAAAALLTDYILTVSVSVSAGVRAVTSAFPEVYVYRIELALIAIMIITWMNLRGVRESGTVFAIPTYAFVSGVLLTVLIGLVRNFGFFGAAPLPIIEHPVPATTSAVGFAYIWLVLRAFAGGTTALTGIEAISNGVQAFKPPESKNAVITMVAMGIMAMSLFLGITYLSTHMSLVPEETETILSQMTRAITGGNFLYYWVQFFTATILILAANTAYQGFPRLGSLLSQDGFLPRWMDIRGARLVFSYGIIVLAIIAAILVVIFQADEIAMLPLYALGVMLCFSISQIGMYRLMGRISHLKLGESIKTLVTEIHYESNARWKRAMNAVGALATTIVFFILMSTKFLEGAWIVVVIIPLLIMMFYAIHRHYGRVATALATRG
jgi:amino acid transporter